MVRTLGILSMAVAVYGYMTNDIVLLFTFVVVGLVLAIINIFLHNKQHKDDDSIAIETLSRIKKR